MAISSHAFAMASLLLQVCGESCGHSQNTHVHVTVETSRNALVIWPLAVVWTWPVLTEGFMLRMVLRGGSEIVKSDIGGI